MGRADILRHLLALGVAAVVSAISLVVLAYLSEYVRVGPREPAERAEPIPMVESPKPKTRQPRPTPVEPVPVRGPEMPALDLPSMVQAPSLRSRDEATASLVRMGLAEEPSFAPTEDLVMSEELVDVAPRAVVQPAPRYPGSAQRQGMEGSVTMRVLVDRQGNVTQVVVAKSEPAGIFDAAAVESISKWRFSPATFKGQPVQVWVRKTLTFRLE